MNKNDEIIKEIPAYESWERLTGESSSAFAAFCVFRDFGSDRNIRKAVENFEKDEAKREKRARVWRTWSAAYKWRERAAEYDCYLDQLKQTEIRKTIEKTAENSRRLSQKMALKAEKKVDLMNSEDLAQGTVTEWALMPLKIEKGIAELSGSRNSESIDEKKNGEITFIPDFEGL